MDALIKTPLLPGCLPELEKIFVSLPDELASPRISQSSPPVTSRQLFVFVVLAFDIIADFLVLSVQSDSEVLGG